MEMGNIIMKTVNAISGNGRKVKNREKEKNIIIMVQLNMMVIL